MWNLRPPPIAEPPNVAGLRIDGEHPHPVVRHQLAHGRIPLTIHLLSPAQRPLAVTSDLASFWQNAYVEVRKDMRGRYPRHPWPEDPMTAPAQRGVKRREF